MQIIPLTAAVYLQTKNKSVTMPILVSNQTPVNLLGEMHYVNWAYKFGVLQKESI